MIGKLDQQIKLQSLAEVNQGGQLVQSYDDVADVWGHVISQRGNEAFESARVNARETIRVKIRFRDDVLTKWRVGWSGQFYNIKHIDRSQRRDGWLWFTAEVVGAT